MNKADIDRRSDLVWKTLILFEAVMYLVKPLRFRPLTHCLAFLVLILQKHHGRYYEKQTFSHFVGSYRILTKSFFSTTSQVSPASCR